jgi:hypothetical protein
MDPQLTFLRIAKILIKIGVKYDKPHFAQVFCKRFFKEHETEIVEEIIRQAFDSNEFLEGLLSVLR